MVTSDAYFPPDASNFNELSRTWRPFALISTEGVLCEDPSYPMPESETLLDLYRSMVIGRAFDATALSLSRQGRLAVYPSSRGQEACQVGAVHALRPQDWLFPTYRDTMALVSRGIPPSDALSLMRGSWHCGYDVLRHRVAPQCTPTSTHMLHAVGVAQAAKIQRQDEVAVVLVGDGAMSCGDAHEALNLAALWSSPVIFLVQNNGYAISLPTQKQSRALAVAAKGVGYGLRALQIDGNDVGAVYATMTWGIESCSRGEGPVLIEAVTYRVEDHTNADDSKRYRSSEEVAEWARRDPLARLKKYLEVAGLLGEDAARSIKEEADAMVRSLKKMPPLSDVDEIAELFGRVRAGSSSYVASQAHEREGTSQG